MWGLAAAIIATTAADGTTTDTRTWGLPHC